MKAYVLIVWMGMTALYGFWPFEKYEEPIPYYVHDHPLIQNSIISGVGSGKTYLEAKSKALNDIATQLQSDVRSITSVHKSSTSGNSTDQQITILTNRQIDNYTIVDETHVGSEVYVLIHYSNTK